MQLLVSLSQVSGSHLSYGEVLCTDMDSHDTGRSLMVLMDYLT